MHADISLIIFSDGFKNFFNNILMRWHAQGRRNICVCVKRASITLQLSETALKIQFLIAYWSRILNNIFLRVWLSLEIEFILASDRKRTFSFPLYKHLHETPKYFLLFKSCHSSIAIVINEETYLFGRMWYNGLRQKED